MTPHLPSLPQDIPRPIPANPHKFIDQLRLFIRSQNKAYQTEKTYVHWVKRFIYFHNKRHPRDMSEAEVEQFLGYLAARRHVSINTQKTALNALAFMYIQFLGRELKDLNFSYAKSPVLLPVVFSHGEAQQIIGFLAEPYRLAAHLMYGCGLRISECCRRQ